MSYCRGAFSLSRESRKASWEEMTGVSLVRSKEGSLVRGEIVCRGKRSWGLARHSLRPKQRVSIGGQKKAESRRQDPVI